MDGHSSLLHLQREYRNLRKNPGDSFSAGPSEGNFYEWEVMVSGPIDTPYEGGMFKAILNFPKTYPQQPPKMYFISDMWHPNVFKSNGEVCISILHPPGDDVFGYEDSGERWRPVHSIETILISVLSMLAAPNIESPANVDAATQFRDNPKEFRKRVQLCVRRSLEDL